MSNRTLAETKKHARVAGLLYFSLSLVVPIGLLYVPSKLFVRGDAVATAERIRSSEWLLRLGIASELFGHIFWIFVALALYRLFEPVNKSLARQLLIFGALVMVPVVALNVVNEIAPLILLSGANFLSVFDKPHLEALAYFFVRLHGQGLMVAEIFWGLWLIPFGLLIIRCDFIPAILGWLLFVAATGYLIDSTTTMFLNSQPHALAQLASLFELGELPIIFWLLIWGARRNAAAAPPAAVAYPLVFL